MQCVGNKAIVFCIFQAYNRLSMHQVIFIVVRSSDRGDLVEMLRNKSIPYSLIYIKIIRHYLLSITYNNHKRKFQLL